MGHRYSCFRVCDSLCTMIQQLCLLLCSATVCVETGGNGIFLFKKTERNELFYRLLKGPDGNFREADPLPEYH
jgi:hypothetical protein